MDSSLQPIITIEGEKIALGPIRKDLIPLYQQWMNRLETTRFLSMGIYSYENEENWYSHVASGNGPRYFTIYELPGYRPIGSVDLHKLDLENRRAELGIMIGEPDARGKGLGTEAVKLMCDFGFNALGLHSIMLLTSGYNVAGQKAYVKAGFKEIGRRREAQWFMGRYWDDVYYDILASDFESPVVKKMITEGIPDFE